MKIPSIYFKLQVFQDSGVFNVNPKYHNTTLLDLLVHNGGYGKRKSLVLVIWCKPGYQMSRAPMTLNRRWISSTPCGRGKFSGTDKNGKWKSCLLKFTGYRSRSNYSDGSQNGNMDMRREVAQFILENDFVAEKQVFKRIVHKQILCLKVKYLF